jgi:hypothetical protein
MRGDPVDDAVGAVSMGLVTKSSGGARLAILETGCVEPEDATVRRTTGCSSKRASRAV